MPSVNALRTIATAVALLGPVPSWADALSAAQARDALAQGATAWDVRVQAPRLLSGAARADLDAWQRGGGVAALQAAVSAAGIDLSRDVVVYGAAGDPQAQALVRALQPVASGRVHWLVGGIDEWQAAGLPTIAQAAARLPIPQRLVALQPEAVVAPPAGASLRQSAATTAPITAGL
jgi:3-mercaptopyruvate sulfurtransferase SseA